jgi:proline racemase
LCGSHSFYQERPFVNNSTHKYLVYITTQGTIPENEKLDTIGSRFTGRIVETTTFDPYPAIIPEVEGTAHITGRHEFLIDPLRDGFILR